MAEFDAWVSGLTDGSYRALSADELSERTQLDAFRELLAARRELRRLELRSHVNETEEWTKTPTGSDDKAILDDAQFRIDDTKRRISQLEIYLGSAGWGTDPQPT
ncbi:MAG: hypothetical protein WDM88_03155 [Galbitalea sp.]